MLSMHCSATADTSGRSSLLFGLSGTGKTTLSADPRRYLVGDDEHCWSNEGIFNIEGGCYAKAVNLTPQSEPDIFAALRFGAVLENVVLEEDRTPDYADTSVTENTRGAYPINFIRNARIPSIAGHPTDIIFLTCDAFGVLPPVSSLTPAEAIYHFMNGYTSKVAGTEMGIKEPVATFSPCFAGPFLVWHPSKYAELLAAKIRESKARVWLVNTGWSGGQYGLGRRIDLAVTRAIIDAIHNGSLSAAETRRDPIFGINAVVRCPNVPREILIPSHTWRDKSAYEATAQKLAELFRKNFKSYETSLKGGIGQTAA
jgi:phosphoenolpyruvate carboxykinase (ATP)